MASPPPPFAESPFAGGALELPTVATTPTALLGRPHEASELLVQFSADADPSLRGMAAKSVGGRVEEEHSTAAMEAAGHGPLARVSVGNGVSLEQAIDILSHRPGVEFAEPDWQVSTSLASND